jgi:predicted porin
MKKSLIALAVLAAAGAASAQSSVTLFGVVDAAYTYGNGSVAKVSRLHNSAYNSSRLGFRGTEDLGGGMSASFWLEAGMANDSGAGANTNANNQAQAAALGNGQQGLTFNRRSTVSLAGGWGELRLGRDYTPQFWNLTVFDPWGTNGVGTTLTLTGAATIAGAAAGGTSGPTIRASNSIGYFLPGNLGGFYGQFQYYMGENLQNGAATEDNGTGAGARVGYANGPLNVGLAFSSTNYDTANLGDRRAVNVGASYNFGVATLMGQISNDKNDVAKAKGFLLGVSMPMGAGEIRASYSQTKLDTAGDPRARQVAVGYIHNLSKRTAVYTSIARVNNNAASAVALNGSATAAGEGSTGFDLGIRHAF